jgi:hypothetical protein
MSFPIPQEALDLITLRGGIGRISDEELRVIGVVRLYDPEHRCHQLIINREYGRLVALAKRIMRECEGYLFAPALARMRGLCGRIHYISRREMLSAAAAAETFMAAGVPPIFDADFLTRTTFVYFVRHTSSEAVREVRYENIFPTVDLILTYGAGSRERLQRMSAARLAEQGERRTKIPIFPANVDDVIRFRTRVFLADNRMDPHFIREMLHYVGTKFRFSDDARRRQVLQDLELALLFLEESLRDFQAPPNVFDTWDGNVNVVKERRWYLRFHPDERSRIVQAYYDSLSGPQRRANSLTLGMLQTLFREQAVPSDHELSARASELEREYLERAFELAASRLDLRGLPSRLYLTEPWATQYVPRLAEVFHRICERSAPAALFRNVAEASRQLPIPGGFAAQPPFKSILNEYRRRALESMLDGDFLAFVKNGDGKVPHWGHAKYADNRTDMGELLLTYVSDRYRSLSDTTA